MKFLCVDANQSLVFSQSPTPEISSDECLIRVHAIGVNRADLLQRAGKYPPPSGESEILGLEVCGEIMQTGGAVSQWQKGDLAFGLVPGGGYAELVKIKAHQLIRLPKGYAIEQGAATAEVFLTAYQSLFTIANLKKIKSRVAQPNVLIHAGASGVGTAAIQLAKASGCYVVATVGSEEKAKALQSLGADAVIQYKESDFVQWSKVNIKGGFDLILDVVGCDYLNKNVNVCALDGHIVMLAMLGGRYSEPLDIAKLLAKRITISASTLRNRDDEYKANLVRDFCHDFYDKLAQEEITPVIDQTYPWHEAELAHTRMANNANIGKLVLTI